MVKKAAMKSLFNGFFFRIEMFKLKPIKNSYKVKITDLFSNKKLFLAKLQKLFPILIFSITFAMFLHILLVITKGRGIDPMKP